MENQVLDTFIQYLPSGLALTNTGFRSMNCVMCHNNGEPSRDTRKKAGIKIDGGSFVYHCFRCKYKAIWKPGGLISDNVVRLFVSGFGMPPDLMQKLKIIAIKLRNLIVVQNHLEFENSLPIFKSVTLPENAKTLLSWGEEWNSSVDRGFLQVLEYVDSLGPAFSYYDYYWSPIKKNQQNKRLIIPFRYKNEIVGWTSRYAGNPPKNIRKYDSHQPKGFLFNNHHLESKRKWIVICEGSMDAIAIDGVAYLGSEPTRQQTYWLNTSGKNIILVPDFDKTGLDLSRKDSAIHKALDNGWYVSIPVWSNEVKDLSEAVQKYGRIFTLQTILESARNDEPGITIQAKLCQK